MPATVQKRSPRISERNIFVKSSIAKPKKNSQNQREGLIYKANLKVLVEAANEINKKRDENE